MLTFLALFACNNPPGDAGVAITPGTPTTLDDLTATVTDAVDPNRKDIVTHSIVWLRDGAEVEDLAGATIVSANLTAKNEEWTVQVTPSDDKENGPTASHTIVIANSLPVATASCADVRSDEDAVAVVGATDDDLDGVSFALSWKRNGTDAGVTGDTVPAASISRGEVWQVTVVPNDGQADGAPVTAEVTIGNALPVVTDALWSDGADPAREDDTLSLSINTSDSDGDTVVPRVVWFVNDIEVGGLPEGQTTLTGEHFDRGDSVRAVVVPNDGFEDGEGFQVEARVIANTAPTAPVVLIDSTHDDRDHVCLASSGDADGDAITFTTTWSVNGAESSSATTTTNPGDTLPFEATVADDEVVCTVVADDGTDPSVPGTDTITVVPVLVLDGSEGNLAAGVYDYGRVELTNSASLTISGTVEIYADSFEVDGDSYIWGVGSGDPADTGTGTGSSGSGGGAGGGAYGGNGGAGGYDSSDSIGVGGTAFGSEDGYEIYAGSGGANPSSGGVAGAGGAALLVEAESIDIAGLINVSGTAGTMSSRGGGGAGGGILLYGDDVAISGALVAAGGAGPDGLHSANDGGGGGGGGRIKVFYGTTYTLTGTLDVTGGVGGLYGDAAYGVDGDDGTTWDEVLSWN